jgi:hypothetical protein
MNYQVYQPCSELQAFIKCIWTLEDECSGSSIRQRVVPDGCMELIIHYGDFYQQFFEDGTSIIQPRSFVFGQITKFIEIAPTGTSGIIAARFLPAGLTPFIDMPVAALENKPVPLDLLFGVAGNHLETAVIHAQSNSERIQLLETFLLNKLTEPSTIDNIIQNCVNMIIHSQGRLGIMEIADELKTNRRAIERKFAAAIGMSPKQLSRAVRLQATLKMLEEKSCSKIS